MRRGMRTGIAVLALSALAACTAEQPAASPGVTTRPAGVASPAVTTPAPEEPILAWADGSPVTGPTIDVLAAAQPVAIGKGVEIVRTLDAKQGWRPRVRDLRPDGVALVSTIEGDLGTGGGPVGKDPYGPPQIVTANGATALTVPDEPDAYVDRAERASFVDGGIAWLERTYQSDYRTWRLLYAPDGASKGTVIAEGGEDDADIAVLAAWGAFDEDGDLVRWTGEKVAAEPRPSDVSVEVVAAGEDMLVTECVTGAEGACDVSILTRDGTSAPFITLTSRSRVVGGDDQHVIVAESAADGSEETVCWVLDRAGRSAVQLIGENLGPSLSDGRVVLTTDHGRVDDERDVIVVDLETRTVERLLVDQRVGDTVIAGDHVAWTTTEEVDRDGFGGAILRWPVR